VPEDGMSENPFPIDPETFQKMKYMATSKHISLSTLIQAMANDEADADNWPKNYYELFRSIDDHDLSVPDFLDGEMDNIQEEM
jgi:hypothetical protein